MIALLRAVRDLCLLRGGPQDLPYAPKLAVWLTAGVLLLGVAASDLAGEGLRPGRLLYTVAFGLAVPWLLLAWRDLRSRYVQTLIARQAVTLVFGLLALPMLSVARDLPAPDSGIAPEPLQILAGWAALGLALWTFAVHAHIWRHALNLRLGVAFVVAAGVFGLNLLLVLWLFGANGAAA